MPPTKKKVVKKRATKNLKPSSPKPQKTTTKKIALSANEDLLIPNKEFINVYEQDPVVQAKSRLVWLIVGVIMLAIILFWFWSLKQSIEKNKNESPDLNKITSEIDNIVSEFKKMVGNSQNIIQQNNINTNREDELEKIKNDVLLQIQVNSDSTNWPEHSSKLLNISLKYPTNWFKEETKDSITITSYSSATTTPELFTKITINQITKQAEDENYQKSNEEIFIDLVPAEKYNSNNQTADILSYLLFINNDKNIYKIDIYTNNKTVFETTINKILSTIDLL